MLGVRKPSGTFSILSEVGNCSQLFCTHYFNHVHDDSSVECTEMQKRLKEISLLGDMWYMMGVGV